MAPKNRKIDSRSIHEKYTILKELEKGRKASDLCRENQGLTKQTLSNWKKNKEKIFATVNANAGGATKKNQKRKRVRSSAYENVEKALYTWFVDARHKKVPLNTSILQTKALYFAKQFDADNFTASDGWLDRWKTRHNISFKTVSGMFHFQIVLHMFNKFRLQAGSKFSA